MSHFKAMVAGADVESILLPYHEYECTGIEEFLEEIDVTDDYISWSFDIIPDKMGPDEWTKVLDVVLKDDIPLKGSRDPQEEYNWYEELDNGEIRVTSRTNPNARWDWWVEGGRWPNSLTTHTGEKGNQFLKREISLQAMEEIALKGLIEIWRSFQSLRDQNVIPVSSLMAHFDKVRTAASARAEELCKNVKLTGSDLAEWKWKTASRLRDELGAMSSVTWESFIAQSGIQLVMEWKLHQFIQFDWVLLETEEELLDSVRDAHCLPFAIVDSNGWREKGEMGWFGMSRNDKASKTWREEVLAWWESLPDDTTITIADCHI